MCRLPTLECYLQFGLNNYDCSPYDLGGGCTGGWAGRGGLGDPALVWLQGLMPEHRWGKKSSGKLEKTFPFPPTLTFYDNSYFQMKGEKSQERNSQMSQKGKKKISEKNFRGKSCSILKSFEGCKVPRFHTFSILFFSDFFSMFNICEMTAFLYLKLDASGFVGRGWWYSRFSWQRKFVPKGLLLAGNCLNPRGRTCQVFLCRLPPFSTGKSNKQSKTLEQDHSHPGPSRDNFAAHYLAIDLSVLPLLKPFLRYQQLFLSN